MGTATTSRELASSGSSSITEWTSVVAPPMSTTATSPCRVARPSTPRSTTSAGGGADQPGERGVAGQVLAPDHPAPGTSRGSRRGRRPGEDTDLGDDVAGEHVRHLPPPPAAPPPPLARRCCRRRRPAGATVLRQHGGGPVEHRGGCRRRYRRAVSTTSGRSGPQGLQRCRRQAAADHGDDATAAGQGDPAAGLGGDQFLIAHHGDPQAPAGARTPEHLGPRDGPVRSQELLTASEPASITSVSVVVRCSARPTRAPDAASTAIAFVNVEPKSTAR
jgi:hypothetical protein